MDFNTLMGDRLDKMVGNLTISKVELSTRLDLMASQLADTEGKLSAALKELEAFRVERDAAPEPEHNDD